MAAGKQVGEISFKLTSISNTLGPGGSVLSQANFEGTGGGVQSATIFNTGTFVGGKSGTYSTCSLAYRDDGEVTRVSGSGGYESTGKHRWRTQGFIESSEGLSRVTEGEIDLATRSWIVKVFEKI